MSARISPRHIWQILGALQMVALLCAFEQPAHAYVDPGSGYVFLQVIGSMCAGAVFYLRHRLRRIFTGAADCSVSNPASSERN